MVTLIVYLFVLLLELFFFGGFAIYTIFLVYSTIKGSPYVPTSKKELLIMLEKAHLKRGQVFLDLGCGDGRVVREAVKKYGLKGVGIEINPLLLVWSRFLAKIFKVKNIEFRRMDIVKNPFPKSDVIYIFLMPKLIIKITPKLKKSLDEGVLIISHGFKVDGLKEFMFARINRNPFPTYFYKNKP